MSVALQAWLLGYNSLNCSRADAQHKMGKHTRARVALKKLQCFMVPCPCEQAPQQSHVQPAPVAGE